MGLNLKTGVRIFRGKDSNYFLFSLGHSLSLANGGVFAPRDGYSIDKEVLSLTFKTPHFSFSVTTELGRLSLAEKSLKSTQEEMSIGAVMNVRVHERVDFSFVN